MAEAIARHRYPDLMEASSAGLFALGSIAPQTRAVLIERGIPADFLLSRQFSKENLAEVDVVINMSGRSGALLATPGGPRVEDWEVGDPYGSELHIYREICDEIELRLARFAGELRSSRRKQRLAAPLVTGRPRRGD